VDPEQKPRELFVEARILLACHAKVAAVRRLLGPVGMRTSMGMLVVCFVVVALVKGFRVPGLGFRV
jgi:hypothetical protein